MKRSTRTEPIVRVERVRTPFLAAHGGAGPAREAFHGVATEKQRRRITFLRDVVRDATRAMHGELPVGSAAPEGVEPADRGTGPTCPEPQPTGARAGVLHAVGMLERDVRFNAGYGSKLQRDGQVRTSAALMDGRRTRMSAVYGVPSCLHPAWLTHALLETDDRNLDALGAASLLASLGSAGEGIVQDIVAPERRASFEEDRLPSQRDDDREPKEGRTGTVGAVAVDVAGELWACTSTGGRGYEMPGRVSDTPTPAGNYACPAIAISVTGVGEEIIDLNIAGRLATRMLDGMPLADALARTMRDVHAIRGEVGLICVAPDPEPGYALYGIAYSTDVMGTAAVDAEGLTILDLTGTPIEPTAE